MKIRTIAAGSDLMAFVIEGTVETPTYRPIAGQNGLTLTAEDTDRESNAKNLGGTVDYFAGLKKYAITIDVDAVDPDDVDAAEVSHAELFDWDLAVSKVDILVTYVTHSAVEGTATVPDTSRASYKGRYRITAPFDGAGSGENITSSVNGKGCQIPLVKVAPTTT
jgi:predicted secreted protein